MKVFLLPIATLFLAVYLYPTSIVHIIKYENIPSNPHYPYYLILYPGEELVGKVTSLPPNTTIGYVEVRGTIYDKWEPRILSRDAFGNCTFRLESIRCSRVDGQVAVASVYIRASPVEVFNVNTTDPVHLGRYYEHVRAPEKALSIYQALSGFFPAYRAAVIQMNMTAFLEIYHRYPHRKEPLYYLARHYRTMDRYSHCLLYARAGMLIGDPISNDAYIEKPIYLYGLELEFAHCLYYSGRPAEAMNQWKRVLPHLPETQKAEIEKTLAEEGKK